MGDMLCLMENTQGAKDYITPMMILTTPQPFFLENFRSRIRDILKTIQISSICPHNFLFITHHFIVRFGSFYDEGLLVLKHIITLCQIDKICICLWIRCLFKNVVLEQRGIRNRIDILKKKIKEIREDKNSPFLAPFMHGIEDIWRNMLNRYYSFLILTDFCNFLNIYFGGIYPY